jgi:hypothetical protein
VEMSGEILRSSRLKRCEGRRIVLEADFWRRRLRMMLPIQESEARPADVPPCFWLGGRPTGTCCCFELTLSAQSMEVG